MGNVFNYLRVHSVHSGMRAEFRDSQDVLQKLKPEDPVYLFNRDHLAKRAIDFQAQFPGLVSYAVKANARNRVLRTLIEQGIDNFDVASISEIRRLRALNPGVQIHFNNPVKSQAAIAFACHEYGVRSFALDDAPELEKILEACADPVQIMLSVRFKLDSHQADFFFGSMFGATPELAVYLLKEFDLAGEKAALTFHPGSQCTEPNEYRRYIIAAAEIASAAKVSLAQLNVGGGFPEYYANTLITPRYQYFKVIKQAISEAFHGNLPPVLCEPGRAMVASSVSLLCRVIHVREGDRIAFINDGVYGGLQEQSLINLNLPLKVWRDKAQLTSDNAAFTVFGPTCDPSDRLPRKLELPADLRAGDYLEFDLVGAYGSATATTFNGFDSQHYVNVRD
jgi:ornithine decarboxylase